jgi:hypothetical protein
VVADLGSDTGYALLTGLSRRCFATCLAGLQDVNTMTLRCCVFPPG